MLPSYLPTNSDMYFLQFESVTPPPPKKKNTTTTTTTNNNNKKQCVSLAQE